MKFRIKPGKVKALSFNKALTFQKFSRKDSEFVGHKNSRRCSCLAIRNLYAAYSTSISTTSGDIVKKRLQKLVK